MLTLLLLLLLVLLLLLLLLFLLLLCLLPLLVVPIPNHFQALFDMVSPSTKAGMTILPVRNVFVISACDAKVFNRVCNPALEYPSRKPGP